MILKKLRLLHFMVQLIYPIGRWNLHLGVNLPQVKNHCLKFTSVPFIYRHLWIGPLLCSLGINFALQLVKCFHATPLHTSIPLMSMDCTYCSLRTSAFIRLLISSAFAITTVLTYCQGKKYDHSKETKHLTSTEKIRQRKSFKLAFFPK